MASPFSRSPGADILQYFTAHTPQLQSKFDALVLAIHAHLLAHNFKCTALTEDKPVAKELNDLPDGWNQTASSGVYTFQYRHDKLQGSAIIVKSLKLDDSTLSVHVVVRQGSNTQQSSVITSSSTQSTSTSTSVDLNVNDYLSGSASLTDYQTLFTDLSGLVSVIDTKIVKKLLPESETHAGALDKSSSTSETVPLSSQSGRVPRPDTSEDNDPLRIGGPRRPGVVPYGGGADFDDDDIDNPLRMPGRGGPRMPGQPFAPGFGGDLDPFARGPATGNLVGPGNFPFPVGNRGNPSLRGGPGQGRARFDEFGAGGREPDADHQRRPGNNNLDQDDMYL